MNRLHALLISLAMTFAMAGLAHAAGEPIGSAVKIVNRVTGDLQQNKRDLTTGDAVRQDEAIEAAADGLGELVLNDDSKLAVGPGARVVLDKFVYDPDASKGKVGINLIKGAFRFVTGLARKRDYEIRTPGASITVRGTVFDVYVDGVTGETLILLHEGAITVCNSQNVCARMSNACGVVQVPASGRPVGLPGWNGLTPAANRTDFATAFPFVVTPPQIDPQPRFERALVETGTCPQSNDTLPLQQRADFAPPSPQAPASYEPAQPTQSPQPAPVEPVLPVTWTSVYAGITIGAGRGIDDTYVNCNDPLGTFDTVFNTPNCAYPIETGALETRYQTDPEGLIGGTTIGFNVQTQAIVWGLEADISRTGISGDDTEFKDVPPTSPGTRTVSQSLDWFGTVRGRLGVATGNVLVYGTGGLAYGWSEYSYYSSYPLGDAFARLNEKEFSLGWTAGAGAEIALGAFSIKGEYLYYDLGQEDFSTQFFIFGGTPTPARFEPEFETKGHIFRIGTNFRLN